MEKGFLDLIKRQQESLDWAKSISKMPAIPESLHRTLSAGFVAGLLSSENGKLTSSIRAMAAKDRLGISDLATVANPVVPGLVSEAAKLKSIFATNTFAFQASAHVKAMSEFASGHHFDQAIRNLRSVGSSSFIADAIKRLNHPALSTSLLASQQTALDQFKELAKAMRSGDVFGEEISKTLRARLGDWREIVLPTLPQSLYLSQGFDRALTEHPTPVFFEVVSDAGLTDATLDIALFGPVVNDIGDENLSDEERNVRCYTRIFRLENRVRAFIREAMTKAYGDGWFKRLPADVKENLREIQERKTKAGEQRTLIECTDFSHYIKIIFKGDLWRDVFQPLFGTRRKEDVLESFNRLKPVRDTAMHCNVVTHEDWVMLYFETDRLLRIIARAAMSR